MESGYGENFPDSLRELCRIINNRFVRKRALGHRSEFAHARSEFAFDSVFVLFDSRRALLFVAPSPAAASGFLDFGEKLPLESSWGLFSSVARCQIFSVFAHK